MKKIKLSEIIGAMDLGEAFSGYLNKKTHQVITINEDDLRMAEDGQSLEELPDWQHETIEEARTFLEHEEDFLALPAEHDVHEYKIMQEFCRSVPNERMSSALLRAIQGAGAFRRFKDSLSESGIIDQWYRYRDRAFKEIAVEWCDAHKIDYIDDVIIPDEKHIQFEKKSKQYAELETTLRELISDESDLIAAAANMAALIYHSLPDVNWAGFYFLKDDQLVLGPFQGQPACMRIALGKGVCGAAAQQRKTIVVPDVHKFSGHIACDTASNAEIVVPLIKENKVLGVLDIDSPSLNRFDATDQSGLENLVKISLDKTSFPEML